MHRSLLRQYKSIVSVGSVESFVSMNSIGSRDPMDSMDPMDSILATTDARLAVVVPASARSQPRQSTLRPGSTPDTPYTPDTCTCADQSPGGAEAPGRRRPR